jgi:hypothetical protein
LPEFNFLIQDTYLNVPYVAHIPDLHGLLLRHIFPEQDQIATMKTTLAVAACFAGASAFAPAAKSSKATALRDVWDDYVGGIKYDGTEFKFDPVSALCFCPLVF